MSKINSDLKARYNIKRHVTVTGKKACGDCKWWQNRQREVETLDHLLDLAQITKVGLMEEIDRLNQTIRDMKAKDIKDDLEARINLFESSVYDQHKNRDNLT